jgi:hypothetical protein
MYQYFSVRMKINTPFSRNEGFLELTGRWQEEESRLQPIHPGLVLLGIEDDGVLAVGGGEK